MSNEQMQRRAVSNYAKHTVVEGGVTEQSVRAHRRRQDGVRYKLEVIEGSGGLLELVEEQPKSRSWFMEYARIMQLTGWTL